MVEVQGVSLGVNRGTGKIRFPGFSPGAEAMTGSWQAWTTGPSADRIGQAAGEAGLQAVRSYEANFGPLTVGADLQCTQVQ